MSWIPLIAIVALILFLSKGSGAFPKILSGGNQNVVPEKTPAELRAEKLEIQWARYKAARNRALGWIGSLARAHDALLFNDSAACGGHSQIDDGRAFYFQKMYSYMLGRSGTYVFMADDIIAISNYWKTDAGPAWLAHFNHVADTTRNQCTDSRARYNQVQMVIDGYTTAWEALDDFFTSPLYDGELWDPPTPIDWPNAIR